MIFDNINNIELYKGLSDDIYQGLLFLKQADCDLAPGVHQICPRVKAIVSEYDTKPENEYGFEAHKQYIDIHYLLSGKEKACCLPIKMLTETSPYSEDGDAAFYSADVSLQPSAFILLPGFFAIFYPQDGHMPQLCVDNPMKVKKVVVKVKVG